MAPRREERCDAAIVRLMAPGHVTYALQFRGQAVPEGAVTLAAARAPSALLVSVVDRDGPHGRFEDVGGAEALLRVTLDRDGPVRGQVDFGGGTTLHLLVVERRTAVPSSRPYLRHGAALLEVTHATGRLAGASGWITSNYLLSDTGDLTDTHLGLLFVERP